MRNIFVLYVAIQSLFIMIIGSGCKQKLEQRDYCMEKQEIADTYLNSTKDTIRYDDFVYCLDKWKETRIPESFWTTLDSKYVIEDIYLIRETGNTENDVYWVKLITKSNKGFLLAQSVVSLPNRVRINTKFITESELQNILNKMENSLKVFKLKSDLGSHYICDASYGFMTARWNGKENKILFYDNPPELILLDSIRYNVNQLNVARLDVFIDSLFYY